MLCKKKFFEYVMDKIDKCLRILKTMPPLLSITSVCHIYVCSEKFCLRFMNLNLFNAIIFNSSRNFYDRSLSGAAVAKVTPNQVRKTLDRHLNKDFSLLLTINYNFCIPYFPISCRKKMICISSLFETLLEGRCRVLNRAGHRCAFSSSP